MTWFMPECEKKEPNVMSQFFLKGFLLLKTSVTYVNCIMDHFTQTEAGGGGGEPEREKTFITGRHTVFPRWTDFCC